jgi:uroporphyrinogen decarboxylase
MGRGFCLDEQWWADWTLPGGTPCKMPAWALPERDGVAWQLRAGHGRVLARMPEGALHFDQIHWPFYGVEEDLAKLPEALESSMWSVFGAPPGGQKLTADGARLLRESTDRAIIGLFGGNLLELGQMLYRMDEFLVMLAGEPERAHEFLDALVEMHLKNLETFLGTVGPYIDIIVFGDDLGAQNCPQISPRMYKEFFQARHKVMWARAKQLANVKVMLHCCGAVRPLLPLLIEAGLDAINPVQISSRGMEAEGLKRDFGADLCFWGGGCDTQRLLPEGRPEEIREHVLRQCEVMAPGGGFVFQQVHNIMANVPAENVIAMFDAVREFNAAGA